MNTKAALPTSEEIDRRLRIVSELRNLCLSLGRARPVANSPGHKDPAEPLRQSTIAPRKRPR